MLAPVVTRPVTRSIALAPGDGVGPEVVEAALPVLEAAVAAAADGTDLRTTLFDLGAERYRETGAVMAPDAMAGLRDHDAILLGAVGHPDVDDAVVAARGHHRIRREFDLWCNRRPARLLDASVCPLEGYGAGDVDLLWVRENGEGTYVDAGGRLSRGGADEVAVQSALHTRRGIERIARAAFEAATERAGHVTSVTKSNVLSHGDQLWDETVAAVAADYPGVDHDHLHADAANLALVERPETFDVAVAPNLFSDVLTDAAAGVIGGLGLAPSANVNPEDDSVPGMYEPVHGTAPDIAGEGVANPLATVLSGALMLDDLGMSAAADAVRRAVAGQVRDPDAPRTPDLGGTATTASVANDLEGRVRGG